MNATPGEARPKREVHPIVKEALDLAVQGETEPVEFTEEGIARLTESFQNLFGRPELFNAVIDLLNLSNTLDGYGSKKASLALLNMVCTAADALRENEKLDEKIMRLRKSLDEINDENKKS
nr:hypothetical protein [Candidatus Sigynarchaeota archaeon]